MTQQSGDKHCYSDTIDTDIHDGPHIDKIIESTLFYALPSSSPIFKIHSMTLKVTRCNIKHILYCS